MGWILGAVTCVAACSPVPVTPEERLRQTLRSGEEAARARDLGGLRELIAEDYRDPQGHEKRDLVRFLAGLFLRHQNIHLLSRIQALEVQGDEGAATVLTALAAHAIDLESLRADVYRLDLRFALRDGEWRLREAQWRPASRADLRELI